MVFPIVLVVAIPLPFFIIANLGPWKLVRQVLDVGLLVQDTGSLQVPPERGGRGEGSTVGSRVSLTFSANLSEVGSEPAQRLSLTTGVTSAH